MNDVDRINASLVAAPRVFSTKTREKLADKGAALPDGSYPIPDKGALARAIASIGRAGPKGSPAYARVKAHIIKRARALGAVSSLPADWNVK